MNTPPDSGIRLNRYLASCGIGSRRSCEALVLEGRVEVNGKIIVDLATRVSPGDYVRVDGKIVRQNSTLSIILSKPRGYICTKSDPEGRKTIYDILPHTFGTLHSVGRLDYQSSGLLILTNSGELTERLTHPRFHVEKEYLVKLERPLGPELVPRLLEGMSFPEGLAKAESLIMESRRRLRIVLTQGYYRQIRRMFKKLDHKVTYLERIRIGSLVIPDLSTGEYRTLSHHDLELATTNPS